VAFRHAHSNPAEEFTTNHQKAASSEGVVFSRSTTGFISRRHATQNGSTNLHKVIMCETQATLVRQPENSLKERSCSFYWLVLEAGFSINSGAGA
jgi:hypothetical protein